MKTNTKILLVDSDRDFVKGLKSKLLDFGFQVITTYSAREAWESILYESPDLVVTEVMLEDYNSGFKLTKRVKGDSRYRDLPLIILTDLTKKSGYEFDFDKDRYWMKADEYLKKSLPIKELVKTINRLLSRDG